MVTIKNPEQIAKMKIAGAILGEGLAQLKAMTKVGVNLLDLEAFFANYLKEQGVESNFLGYYDYPATTCISVNDQLVHGIPRNYVIQDGDLVSIDAGCIYQGMHADAAFTTLCGSPKSEKDVILLEATEESLELAIKAIHPGTRIGDIGATIQTYIEGFGFHLPRDYTGHGIGTAMHEDPYVPNVGTAGTGMKLVPGMVIAIEPMVQIGTAKTYTGKDGWTVYSADHSRSAHFEHTILITDTGAEVLTRKPVS